MSQGQLNRRIRGLEPELRALQHELAGTLAGPSEAYRMMDKGVVTAFFLAPANSDERPIGEALIALDGHRAHLANKGFSSVA